MLDVEGMYEEAWRNGLVRNNCNKRRTMTRMEPTTRSYARTDSVLVYLLLLSTRSRTYTVSQQLASYFVFWRTEAEPNYLQ
jgi:hypothetical protein